ncbi:MAG: type II secretion system F family protein [Sumerlaeia bacterium]
MPTFAYKAKNQDGAPVDGTLEAENRPAVAAILRQMGYFPISVQEEVPVGVGVVTRDARDSGGNSLTRIIPKLFTGSPSSDSVPQPGASQSKTITKSFHKSAALNLQAQQAAARKLQGKRAPAKPVPGKAPSTDKRSSQAAPSTSPGFFSGKRVTSSDIASFNRQLADLLGAGIPLVKALSILQKQSVNLRLREIIAEINTDVSGGTTFADALAKNPREFSKLYVAMVRSGEAGGMLDDVLKRLADYSEQDELTKSKIKSALAYPVVMILVGMIAVSVMFVYIIPKITGVFKELNQTLPAMTQMLITSSEFTQNYWYIVLGAIVAIVVFLTQLVRTQDGRLFWHKTQLRLPLIGDLVRKQEVARFSRTLGSLLKNGVSILTALKITRDVLNNEIVRLELDSVLEGITQGQGIAEPLRTSIVFPQMTVNMMSVGEETGQLEAVLLRISESFEAEVDRKVRTLTSLIEPLIIVALGLVVGFIVIAMLLPIFSLNPGGG